MPDWPHVCWPSTFRDPLTPGRKLRKVPGLMVRDTRVSMDGPQASYMRRPRRLKVRHGIKLADGSKLAGEPFENDIVHGDEVLDLAQRVRDAVRHDGRAIGFG